HRSGLRGSFASRTPTTRREDPYLATLGHEVVPPPGDRIERGIALPGHDPVDRARVPGENLLPQPYARFPGARVRTEAQTLEVFGISTIQARPELHRKVVVPGLVVAPENVPGANPEPAI